MNTNTIEEIIKNSELATAIGFMGLVTVIALTIFSIYAIIKRGKISKDSMCILFATLIVGSISPLVSYKIQNYKEVAETVKRWEENPTAYIIKTQSEGGSERVLLVWDEGTAFLGKPTHNTYNLKEEYYDALKDTPAMKTASIKETY